MGFDFLDWGFPKSGTDWKSINGKPFINVSAKGRSNGLSTKINDGADFGPDTTLNASSPNQNGAPYTQTNGISEAINYALTINPTTPPTIMLLNGNFNCSAQISIQNNSTLNTLVIRGQGANDTNIILGLPTNEYLFNFSMQSPFSTLKISDLTYYSNNNGLLNFISTSQGQVYLDNVQQGGGSGSIYSVIIQGTSTAGLDLVQLTGCQGNPNNGYGYEVTWYIAYAHQVSLIGGNGWMTFENCFDVTGVGVHTTQLQFISDNSVTLLGCHNVSINAYGTMNSITIIGGNTYANYNTIAVPPSQSLTLDALIVDGLTLLDATEDVGFLYFYDAVSLTINNALIRNLNSNNSYTFTYVPLNLPSTPAVPASGTAVQNTNPYPVDVYVYGGTVTEIQITRNRDFNGATYTVFSNSSGLALSGQNFKLNPTDTITITYTAAPSWTWVSAE